MDGFQKAGQQCSFPFKATYVQGGGTPVIVALGTLRNHLCPQELCKGPWSQLQMAINYLLQYEMVATPPPRQAKTSPYTPVDPLEDQSFSLWCVSMVDPR